MFCFISNIFLFWNTVISYTPQYLLPFFSSFLLKKTLFNWQKLWHKESKGCRLNWLFAQSCVSARCSTPRGNNVKQITRSNAGEFLLPALLICFFLIQTGFFPHTLSRFLYWGRLCLCILINARTSHLTQVSSVNFMHDSTWHKIFFEMPKRLDNNLQRFLKKTHFCAEL